MHFLDRLFEQVIMEAAALSKGSQRVLADKKMVANLADAMRDDARSHPQNFPANSSRTFQKAPDEELAQWFLENLDKIEREGYEGTVYSRDGAYSDWIARRYIAGSHNWEDITGVMNMNLRDWTLLKNRNMLDPNHRDIPKFNSVRDVGKYMTTHYSDKLEKIRDAAKNAARNKMAKSVKLVDNDDYRIYTTLNRAAGCALGLGTQWCTANSNYPGHFNTYSSRAMLFQLFPYTKEEKDGQSVNVTDEDGKPVLNDKDKYQFDAGGPTFMDITDTAVMPAAVAKKFPYIFTDLSKALKANKSKMEQAFKDLSADPTMQGDDFKIKTYEIDDEIQKLHKFVDRGYFTDEVRPKSLSSAEGPEGDQPQELPAPQQPQGNRQMESIKELARVMLEDRLSEFASSGEPPKLPPKLPPKEPDDHWGDEDDDEEDHPRNYFYLTDGAIKIIEAMYKSIGDPDPVYGVNDRSEIRRVTELYKNIPKIRQLANIFKDSGIGAGLKFYLTLPKDVKESLWYSWDGHGLNVEQDCKKFGLNYDLDLTEDESRINKTKENTMENVDKDVAAMLASLKKYDKLVESVSPVLGMVTLGAKPQLNELSQDTLKSYKQGALDDGRVGMIKGDQAKMDKRSAGMKKADSKIKEEELEESKGKKPDFLDMDKDGDKKEPMKKALKDKEKVDEDTEEMKGKKEAAEIDADKEEIAADDLHEGADTEVLNWMKRFAGLGKMSGY